MMLAINILAGVVGYTVLGCVFFAILAKVDVTIRPYDAPAMIILWPLVMFAALLEIFGRWATK